MKGAENVHGGHGQHAHLAHHFTSLKQQYESTKLGMWLFLITEVLLFGGLFVAYSVYRANHPEIFIYGHKYLDTRLGAINTVILICSSLTIALGVRCAQLGQRGLLILFLALTILGGLGFLGIKYVEYEQKWKHGLLWGKLYKPQAHSEREMNSVESIENPENRDTATTNSIPLGNAQTASEANNGADTSLEQTQSTGIIVEATSRTNLNQAETQGHSPESATIEDKPKNVQLFFAVYFAMTGLHGLHVLIGIIAISVILVMAVKGKFSPMNFTAVDLTGLYWHLVDLIWIYLFPLFYLIH